MSNKVNQSCLFVRLNDVQDVQDLARLQEESAYNFFYDRVFPFQQHNSFYSFSSFLILPASSLSPITPIPPIFAFFAGFSNRGCCASTKCGIGKCACYAPICIWWANKCRQSTPLDMRPLQELTGGVIGGMQFQQKVGFGIRIVYWEYTASVQPWLKSIIMKNQDDSPRHHHHHSKEQVIIILVIPIKAINIIIM